MPIRTTVDIPEPLHDRLRAKAEQSGTSIRALIIRAIEQAYTPEGKTARVRGALVKGPGKLGPQFPTDRNPHDLILP